jgi:uncharacterized Tic20 family protein
MEAESAPVPTSDERILAGIAHLFGILVALIVWASQKEKSRFVHFQAVQAIAFDAVAILVSLILSVCLTGSMVVGMFGGLYYLGSQSSPGDIEWLFVFQPLMMFLFFICLMPYSLLLWMVRLIATVSVIQGKDFRYPLMGKQVERFLST